MADAGGQDLEQHLGALGLRRWNLVAAERLAAGADLEAAHGILPASSWPGSRPSRFGGQCALLIEIAGSSPAMTVVHYRTTAPTTTLRRPGRPCARVPRRDRRGRAIGPAPPAPGAWRN